LGGEERATRVAGKRAELVPLWLWLLAVVCAGLSVRPGFAVEPLAKVVRQYALTSANDFPQRDPRDWRLLASNDGGRTWVTLDVRTGEVFSERHQRRVFSLANRQAFNVYRLQIDRVLDPLAASCVQLAEIAPLGETEDDVDPVPTSTDLITAEGENPPVESRLAAFDGLVETKWLDHADRAPATRASWVQWQYLNPGRLVVTNVSQLLGLRTGASRGYPVRIEGVVAGRLPGTNLVCFLDGTGYLEISAAAEDGALSVSQRVLLTGTTRWTNRQAGAGDCRLQVRGPKAGVEPRHIALEQPLAPEDELQWVEAEGQMRFCTWRENRLTFELQDGGRTLSVRVLHPGAATQLRLAGARVRVQGICETVLDEKGERVAGALWVPTLDAVVPADLAKVPTNAPDGREPPPAPGGAAAPLASLKEIRQLSPEQLLRRPRVQVRGVVTELLGGFIQEDAVGIEVWCANPAVRTNVSFGARVEIEGSADWAVGHGPILRAETVAVLGQGKLPRPERCSWSELASGRGAARWVEVEGVVRSTDGSHLLLGCEGGQLMATIRAAPVLRVKQLVDATVRVRGVGVEATDSRGRGQGVQLVVPSLEYVEVEEAPAEPFSLPTRLIGSLLQGRERKEFTHRVKVEGVLTYRDGHRYFLQDQSGAVMATEQEEIVLTTPPGGWNWIFWQSSRSHATPELELAGGDRLEVVGFPEMRGYSPVLTEALVRKLGHAGPVPPVKATVEELARGALDSTRVSLDAELLRGESLDSAVVLELQSDGRVFQASWPAKGRTPLAIEPGSRVRVTGVCQVEALPDTELGKRAASFKLLVGAPSDLILLSRPPWWTLKRALAATGTLVVGLVLAGAWIAILRRQVEKQTRRLQAEIAEHQRTEARLAEEKQLVQAEFDERKRAEAEVERSQKELLKASRLAGMAEVATSVLHNVGNVLNSANVLAAVLVENLQRSKVPSIGKLAQLLGEHRADLGRFVTEDERGRHLPGYLERLAGHLGEEQGRLLDKVKLLTESLQHIKEVVAMQQNYAKVSGVLERVAVAEIVEDALRMHNEALTRHKITVIRHFEEAPLVTLDRHKLLQILFNLLENAKYACDESGRPDKQISLRIQSHGMESVWVTVTDNGVGIPAENLPRIFAQEFSTRKNGHGFGLHSSILAAQDMGGSLRVQSDGPGQGASFILEAPITPILAT